MSHNCVVTAFAQAMTCKPEELEQEMGFTGMELWFKDRPEPLCRRGVHTQELFLPCWRRGWAIVKLDSTIKTSNWEQTQTYDLSWVGGLAGQTVVMGRLPDGRGHACLKTDPIAKTMEILSVVLFFRIR